MSFVLFLFYRRNSNSFLSVDQDSEPHIATCAQCNWSLCLDSKMPSSSQRRISKHELQQLFHKFIAKHDITCDCKSMNCILLFCPAERSDSFSLQVVGSVCSYIDEVLW